MKLHHLLLSGLFMTVLGSASVQAAPLLKVLSASPKGQQGSMGRQAVNVHFNQPVVKLGEKTAFASPDCPLKITPAVEGSCHFSGTQTLVFEPSGNWPDATRFTVTLPKGFASSVSGQKLAASYKFSFNTQVPQVLSVLPYTGEHWISLNPTIYVLTSQSVDLSRATPFIKLISVHGKAVRSVPVSVRVPTEEELNKSFSYLSSDEKKHVFAINPTETLQMGQKYTVTLLAGLPGKTGNVGMSQKYETSFFTFAPLTVQKVLSTGCLPFTPSLHFSSPVRKRELWSHLETFPAYTKQDLSERDKESLGSEVVNPKTQEAYFDMPLDFITIKPHEPVQVTLRKGLRDIYGNTLEEDQHFIIENNGYCPAVDFSAEGFGVLESYLPARLPIALMNMPKLLVESARFNKDNFIPFQEKQTSYCAKKQLTGATFSGEYAFADVKDKTLRSYIDLSRFAPTAKDSIIFSQFKMQRAWDKSDCWLSATDNLTDIGVTFKTSSQDILIWTTSLKTGAPLGGLAVELRSRDNKVIWTGTTDVNGLVRAPGWGKLDVAAAQWGQPTLYAFITSPGGDAVVSNLWNDGMEPWRFSLNYEYNPTAQQLRGYVFTERAVYRPGETVYIKGVVREQRSGTWKLPDTVRGTVTIHDANGNEILKKEVTIGSQFGTFDMSFELPQTAGTGYWDVNFTPQITAKDPQEVSTSFQVEAVKPADFNVFIKPDMTQYIGGEEATFAVAAQYYFGAPLSMAKAKWNLRQETAGFTPKGYESYTFTPYFLQRGEDNTNGKLLLSASGELDSRGALLFSAKMPRVATPVRVYAEADIQSPAHQNLFKRTSVLVHPADIYVGAKAVKDSYEEGSPVDVHVVAVTPQGQAEQTVATAEIYKEEYYSVRKVGLAGRLEWVGDKKVIQLPSQKITIGKKGATLSFVPQEAGSYYIKLSATDLFGRRVTGGIDVYVRGKGQSYGPRTDDDLLKLTQNKNEYKVGQTARIRVQSPYDNAQALITVEREGILDAWTTVLSGGENTVNVPIKESYLPNVYVSILVVQGRTAKPATRKEDLGKPQGKIGYVNLNVVPDAKRIVTTLKTNAKKYQPGQQVVLSLSTKVQGKAVPAEVVVMAVDEGILALSNYQTPDLFDVFYGSNPLSVFTMDNRSYVIGQRNFGEKGENRGGGGAAASKLGGTDLRSRFMFTPYYAASVKTDAKGRANLSFELPDNLTTFRVMAVALTTDEFGNAQSEITVSKPVMVTPSMPRFARENDRFSCGVIVYNYEDEKGKFTVQASAMGNITLEGPQQQTVSVPKGSSREVLWQCQAGNAGEATVAFVAKGRYSDGVQNEIAIFTAEKEQSLTVYAATQQTQQEITDEPRGLNATANNRVTLSVASSALLQLKGAISYLLTYPYNCLEQQLSKIVPVVTAEPLIKDFQLADVVDLRKSAQEVLSNLGNYQHACGGLGYWPGALPDPYVTAYALDVSLQAKQAGFDVPTAVIDKAVAWLENAFSQNTQRAYVYNAAEVNTLRAYSAYVLTRYGKNTDSLFNTLYAKRVGLSQTAVAYLLRAAHAAGRSPSVQQALAQQLLNKLVYTPAAVYADAGETLPWLHESNVTATAQTLRALLAAGLSPDTDYQMAAWLVSQLNAHGHWNDTHTNAVVLQALQTYYNARENTLPRFTATVKQGDQIRLSAQFEGRSLQEQTVQIPFSTVYAAGAEARFSFTKQGSGTMYYTLGQRYTPASYDTPVDSGFSITRTLSTLDGKPVHQILVGERYKVTLHIKSAAPRTFVAAADYIPAGFALVNTTLATESATQAELLAADNTAFVRTEQYDDRIYGFADELPAGEQRFSYLVTALAAGQYTYPAAWVSQMYAPEVFGRNTTSKLVIK